MPGTANTSSPDGVWREKISGMKRGSVSENASVNVTSGSERPGSSGYAGVTDSTISAPSASRRTFLISWSICALIAAWLGRGRDHVLPKDGDPHPLQRLAAAPSRR